MFSIDGLPVAEGGTKKNADASLARELALLPANDMPAKGVPSALRGSGATRPDRMNAFQFPSFSFSASRLSSRAGNVLI